jgi:hypothetical protein
MWISLNLALTCEHANRTSHIWRVQGETEGILCWRVSRESYWGNLHSNSNREIRMPSGEYREISLFSHHALFFLLLPNKNSRAWCLSVSWLVCQSFSTNGLPLPCHISGYTSLPISQQSVCKSVDRTHVLLSNGIWFLIISWYSKSMSTTPICGSFPSPVMSNNTLPQGSTTIEWP